MPTEEFAYDGREGQTRRETVHVPDGAGLRTLSVHRVVNVATDPRLRAAALDGSLHALDGLTLALPFVFHDPVAHRFALVLPTPLAHTALSERAALLERLASDTAHRVPPYVAEARVVLGIEGLASYLDGSSLDTRARELEGREDALGKRAADLEERERRLADRAEAITRREDELRLEAERAEASARDLAQRESALEERFARLREREDAAAKPARTDPAIRPAGDLASDVEMLEEEPAGVELLEATPDSDEFDDVGATAAELSTDEPATELIGAELIGAELLDDDDDDDDAEELDDDVVAEAIEDSLDDDDLEEELEEEEAPEPEPTMIHREEEAPVHRRPRASVAPPEAFFDDPLVEMSARLGSEGVWLHARLGEGYEDSFQGDVDLLVQYVAVDEVPVVLLTLVDPREPRPYARRAALDPNDDDDRAILEALREDFRVTVGLYSPEGRFERTREVAAPERRTNLTMILERANRAEGRLDPVTALERALAAPPPLQLRGHPFDDAPPAQTAKDASNAVATLGKWASPAKLDLALLALSIPRQRVDDAFRRILEDAVRHGIALPSPLVSRAISLGVSPEPGELVLQLVDAFRGTARLPDRGGLGPDGVVRNWEQLIALASELEVALPSEAHDAAWEDIRAVRGEAAAPKEVAPEALRDMPSRDVSALLDHPRMRRASALELCRRAEPELVSTIFGAVRKMPRDEVLEVAPRLIALGEAAADALIDGLTARKTFVRQAATLALGELKLRRAIGPLVHLLQTEPSEVWWEVARVLSSFGPAALRPMQRAMKDPKGAEERFSYALAHLASTEPEKVRGLETDGHAKVRAIAVAAMTQKPLAEKHLALLARGGEDDGVHAFSRRFYAALNAS
ncbi:MAG: HEAT repeat domain-containing protein [Sandaracinus sp.]|nr:HEAT repeat domain-containing protein [Sandaracinus sp.]